MLSQDIPVLEDGVGLDEFGEEGVNVAEGEGLGEGDDAGTGEGDIVGGVAGDKLDDAPGRHCQYLQLGQVACYWMSIVWGTWQSCDFACLQRLCTMQEGRRQVGSLCCCEKHK